MEERIAIIAASSVLPGSLTEAEFWQNLSLGRDCTSEATAADLGGDPELFRGRIGDSDKAYNFRGGFVREARVTEASTGVSAHTFAALDRGQRWAMHVARAALQQAGYLERPASLRRCGVVLGQLSFPTELSNSFFLPLYQRALVHALSEAGSGAPLPPFDPLQRPDLGDARFVLQPPSAVVASLLGLGASHFSLDSACSSAFYALALASALLRSGAADLMLAGAVSAGDPLFVAMGFSMFRAYPEPPERSRPLDRESKGLCASEGAGVVVLKRLSDAVRDGDRVLATLLGIGLSNDGRGRGVLSPAVEGEVLSFERAYRQAGIAPGSVDYVECHATGTALGDRIELEAMERFYGAHGATPRLGSVKANVGHLLTAAGMASLHKVLLAMQHGEIPPTPGVRAPIADAQVVAQAWPWPQPCAAHNRRAALSAFGFGGCNAHLLIEQGVAAAPRAAKPPAQLVPEPLAIVGMALHFGTCDDVARFDELSYRAADAARERPSKRWKGLERALPASLFQTTAALRGAYLDDFDFDFLSFRLPPNPDERLTAQQLVLLKVADAALRDAGRARGGNVGVIVGMQMDLEIHQYEARGRLGPWLERALSALPDPAVRARLADQLKDALSVTAQLNRYTSLIGNIMASRVAAQWDFTGPAFTLSAQESSVFRALEVARLLLADSELEAVLIAGVDMAASAESVLLRSQRGPLGSGPPKLGFAEDCDGWSLGEGAGAIVLVRERDVRSRAAGAWASVRGLSIQHGADARAVEAAARAALAEAGVASAAVEYLEASAPGFPALDDAELMGLSSAYGEAGAQRCALGSVASVVGHTFHASGIAALIRAALCLHQRYLPGAARWTRPRLPLDPHNPFYVLQRSRAWVHDVADGPRLAALSSVSDVSCHVILSEPAKRREPERSPSAIANDALTILPLRAADRAGLQLALEQLQRELIDGRSPGRPGPFSRDASLVPGFHSARALLDRGATIPSSPADQAVLELHALAGACYTRFRDASGLCSAALVAGSADELRRELTLLLRALDHTPGRTEIATPAGSYLTCSPLGREHGVSFVYPGAFNTYFEAGHDIFRYFPEMHDKLRAHSSSGAAWINDPLLAPRSLHRMAAHELRERMQACLDAPISSFEQGILLSVLYTDVVRDCFGVQAASALGFSMGEISMLFALGVFQRTDTMSQRLAASPLFRSELAGPMRALRRAWNLPRERVADRDLWRGYTLHVAPERARAAVAGEPYARLILINSPRSVVIAGLPEACERVIAQLGCEAVAAALGDMIHCDLVRPSQAALAELHRLPVQATPPVRFFSAVGYGELPVASRDLGQNIAEMYCDTVDFPRLVRVAYQQGARIFLELGPRDSCTANISEILAGLPHLAVATDRKGIASYRSLLQALAKLWCHQVPLDLSRLYEEPKAQPAPARSLLLPVQVGGPAVELAPSELALLRAARRDRAAGVIWDLRDLTTFAEGKIADVFGPEFAVIDGYRRRVRLPTSEYLLVTRVTELRAQPRVFEPSSITTEYDIPRDAWYSCRGQVPSAVVVEAGQCDLLLISYLGIDFQNKGELVYRLLDCTLTFLAPLPREGDTVRYEIHIDSFARQGENLLFFFRYECFCGDRLILKMDGGVAGFFNDQQLAAGRGIIRTAAEEKARSAIAKRQFSPWLPCDKRSFNADDLASLCAGDLARCFGRPAGERSQELAFSAPKMLMIDHVAHVDPAGGPWGLGLVVATKALAPDHWYFPCHFKDDQVMAGSLMAEGCSQLLRFYVLYIGMHALTTHARFQPVPGEAQRVRCRGQVTPQHGTLVYRMEVCELATTPYPLAKANVQIELDGKVIVEFKNLSMYLAEQAVVAAVAQPEWPLHMPQLELARDAVRVPSYVRSEYPVRRPPFRPFPGDPRDLNCVPDTLPFTWYHFTEFATGRVANCFGEACAFYDDRQPPRTPNTELQLVTRVVAIDAQRLEFKRAATCFAEFDCPADAWFIVESTHARHVPYAMFMEIALQPCGFISAWVGTTVTVPDKDLCFRNLDGSGRLLADVDVRGKTIKNRSTLLETMWMGSTIIQRFELELSVDGVAFYAGTAVFGYFERAMLAQQAGLDKGQRVLPWHAAQRETGRRLPLREEAERARLAGVREPHFRLAGGRLNFVDYVEIFPRGGKLARGYVFAERRIDANEWFFACHFHQDPVMPGSLGVEAMFEMLQAFALEANLGQSFERPRFQHVLGETRWKYRGQITPRESRMSVDIHVTAIDQTSQYVQLEADGNLYKDGLRIYEVKGLRLRIVADAVSS